MSMTLIHEYHITEMPKKRILDLFRRGAKVYKICEQESCINFGKYEQIVSELELMTYCLQCGHKVVRYGVEGE